MRTLLLMALGACSLTACQTTEEVTDDAADIAEDAYSAVADAAGDTWNAATDVFDDDASAYAVALVRPTTSPSASAQGTVSFRESDGGIVVAVSLSGLRPGPHAVHVHENAACGRGEDGTPGGAAGGHWDPLESGDHGAPTASLDDKHLGDFGNFEAGADGTAEVVVAVAPFPTEEFSVAGHAVIVHEGRDDLSSDPAGAAGARVGCGITEGRM